MATKNIMGYTFVYISKSLGFIQLSWCNPKLREGALCSLKFVPLVTWKVYAGNETKTGVLIAQICLPPTSHKSLWAQKVQFRCCGRQYKHHPSTSTVISKFLFLCKWKWEKFVLSKWNPRLHEPCARYHLKWFKLHWRSMVLPWMYLNISDHMCLKLFLFLLT